MHVICGRQVAILFDFSDPTVLPRSLQRVFLLRILPCPFISGPIKFLIRLLKKSLGMVRHKYFGFSSAELAEGLTQIAVNDNNKKTVCQACSFRTLQVLNLIFQSTFKSLLVRIFSSSKS